MVDKIKKDMKQTTTTENIDVKREPEVKEIEAPNIHSQPTSNEGFSLPDASMLDNNSKSNNDKPIERNSPQNETPKNEVREKPQAQKMSNEGGLSLPELDEQAPLNEKDEEKKSNEDSLPEIHENEDNENYGNDLVADKGQVDPELQPAPAAALEIPDENNSQQEAHSKPTSEETGYNKEEKSTNQDDSKEKEAPAEKLNENQVETPEVNKQKDPRDKSVGGIDLPNNPGENASTAKNTADGKDKNLAQKALDKAGSGVKDKLNDAADGVEAVQDAKKAVDTSKRIGNTVKAAGTTIQTIIGVLTNPVTLVVLGALLFIGLVQSGRQVLGPSDFANNCSTSGTLEVGELLGGDEMERADTVANWLMTTKFETLGGKPFTKEQAAGAIGNFHIESTVNSISMELNGAYGSEPNYKDWPAEKIKSTHGNNSHAAIGLAQWDGGRRPGLLEFAAEKKKPWYDATVQLERLQFEIDGAESGSLKKGFTACTTVGDCTSTWRRDFERGGAGTDGERTEFAQKWYDQYKGGGSKGLQTDSGSVSACSTDEGIDTSDIVKLALDISYPAAEYHKSNVSGSDLQGRNNAKPGYKKAKEEAEKNGGKDGHEDPLYASCDRFVATLLKATKSDVDIPWGPTSAQYSYLKSSSKWKEVPCGDRKAGDVLITRGDGHIMMYVGKVDGTEQVASASFHDRVAAVGPGLSCSGDSWNADGRSGLAGFRLVNNK